MRNAETVFSLKFSSAGKGPLMAGKAKNAPKAHVPRGGGGGGGEGEEVHIIGVSLRGS